MPWTRLEDDLDDNRKIQAVSNDAVAVWVCSLTFSNRKRTDGFLAESDVRRLLGIRQAGPSVVEELLAVPAGCEHGLWEKRANGYVVHDFLQYNKSRAQLEQEAEDARKRAEDARAKAKSLNSNGSSSEVRTEFVQSSEELHTGVRGAVHPPPVPRIPVPGNPVPMNPEDERANEPSKLSKKVDKYESDEQWLAALKRSRQVEPANAEDQAEWCKDIQGLRVRGVRISDVPEILRRCQLPRNAYVTPATIRERLEWEESNRAQQESHQ